MKLTVVEGCRKYIVAVAEAFIAGAPQVTPILHPLKLVLVPAHYLNIFEYPALGVFCATGVYYRAGTGRSVSAPCMIVAAEKPRLMPRWLWIKDFQDTLCHELAHYEQFRDGKSIQDRGVAVRSRSLQKIIWQQV